METLAATAHSLPQLKLSLLLLLLLLPAFAQASTMHRLWLMGCGQVRDSQHATQTNQHQPAAKMHCI
jgi:hypothetical protein